MSIHKMEKNKSDIGRDFIEDIPFFRKKGIPMWEVMDVCSFTKLIGHAKYINAHYGNVFYRGQTRIRHLNEDINGFYPSAYRPQKSASGSYVEITKEQQKRIDEVILSQVKSFLHSRHNKTLNKTFSDFLHTPTELKVSTAIGESVLQHYGAKTRYLDVVDNPWIALWFASHKYINTTKCYVPSQEAYSYIAVFALPSNGKEVFPGVFSDNNTTIVDLRKACPSTALRPHMQHGLLFTLHDSIDFAENTVCVIRIRTDLCLQWIGETALLREESIFPNTDKDELYRLLQYEQKSLFKDVCNQINNMIKR